MKGVLRNRIIRALTKFPLCRVKPEWAEEGGYTFYGYIVGIWSQGLLSKRRNVEWFVDVSFKDGKKNNTLSVRLRNVIDLVYDEEGELVTYKDQMARVRAGEKDRYAYVGPPKAA